MKTFSLSLSVLLSSSLAWADEPSPSKDVETTQTEAAGHSESAPTGATSTPQSNGESTEGWTPPTSKQQGPADDSPWSRPFTGESDSPVSKAGRPFTPEELLILDKGLYSSGEIYGGAAMGFVIGYGTGHMIQGRYGERGWIATVGTLGGITVIISAVGKTCTEIDAYGDAEQTWCGGTRLLTGLLVIVGTKVWEVADLLSTPKAQIRDIEVSKNGVYGYPSNDRRRTSWTRSDHDVLIEIVFQLSHGIRARPIVKATVQDSRLAYITRGA